MYIQFGKCFCKGIQLNDYDFIIIDDLEEELTFELSKMSDHRGTICEIGFPETEEMVATINNLMQDGLKYRKLKELLNGS